MGLYRTLLFQILAASPGLAPTLLPEQWAKALSQKNIHSAYEILDDDIKRAYERLSKQHDGSSLGEYCFAFFIDGLDEYQPTPSVDRREMVHCLTDLATSNPGRFKICVSSRMENPFMDTFSEDTRLYLHKLTRTDMKEYVAGNLQCVGTQRERKQLASSITDKAEGVFLWAVLVVQRIRKQSDDGARISRLLREVESLPTELSDLFQQILDNILETTDRRLMSHTVSLLHFLGDIPKAKKKYLWLNLGDFYFLEDYEADPRFAERAPFPKPESETPKERGSRARRQLRGICRGLVEADEADDIGFTHRSVRDFFKQDHVRIEMRNESFDNIDALSQLKLASMRQYWWDVEQQNFGGENDEGTKAEEESRKRHSILAAFLVAHRRRRQLDAPPFDFLECLDTIPQLCVSTTVRHALACKKTAFHINLASNSCIRRRPYCQYEICHTSRVQHWYDGMDPELLNHSEEGRARGEPPKEQSDAKSVAVPWRPADEHVDDIEEYSTAVVSPLFTELCSGHLEYPLWKVERIHDKPLEPDKLAMLVYFAIGAGVGRVVWTSCEDGDTDLGTSVAAGILLLRHLFKQQIVSPNLVTHLAFGGEFGFIRIAAGNQRLSIWQHFICWWATAAAASGEFETEGDASSGRKSSKNSGEQSIVGSVLETFIENGADLQLMLKITDRGVVDSAADDIWLAYTLEMVPYDGEAALELDVVLNTEGRMALTDYPYGPPNRRFWERCDDSECGREVGRLPNSPLSLRDWIGRSRLPNKRVLFKLIDDRLGVVEPISGADT